MPCLQPDELSCKPCEGVPFAGRTSSAQGHPGSTRELLSACPAHHHHRGYYQSFLTVAVHGGRNGFVVFAEPGRAGAGMHRHRCQQGWQDQAHTAPCVPGTRLGVGQAAPSSYLL